MTISFGRRSPASKPTIDCSECGRSCFLHSLVFDGLCEHAKAEYEDAEALIRAANSAQGGFDEAR